MKWICVGGPLDGQEKDDGGGPWTNRPGDNLFCEEIDGVLHEYQSAEFKGKAVMLYKQNGVFINEP